MGQTSSGNAGNRCHQMDVDAMFRFPSYHGETLIICHATDVGANNRDRGPIGWKHSAELHIIHVNSELLSLPVMSFPVPITQDDAASVNVCCSSTTRVCACHGDRVQTGEENV